MALVVLLAVTGVVANETMLLYVWTVAVILAHIHYGVSVVRTYSLLEVGNQFSALQHLLTEYVVFLQVQQLSNHFNIKAFSLKKPNADWQEEERIGLTEAEV